jgi:TRAP-type C4-dicarboxylate transport system substrate-binding protein
MRRKLRFMYCIILCVALIFTGCSSGGGTTEATTDDESADRVITVKLATSWAPTVGAYQWVVDEIEKRSEGKVKFETYWTGSLVTSGEELKNVDSGVIDMTYIHNLYYMADMKLTGWAWNIPFIASDTGKYADITAALWNEFPEMRNELEKYNIKVWPEFVWGTYDITTKFPFNRLSDLDGHKVNFAGATGEWGQVVGCSTVSIVMGEIFQSLQTGVCEGGNWTASFMLPYKFYDAGCKYITHIGMGCRTGGYPVINKDFWDSLPPDVQQIFDEVITEGRAESCKAADERYQSLIDEGEANGVTFATLPDEDIAEWAELCKPSVQKYIQTLNDAGYDGEKFVKRIQELHIENGTPMLVDYLN